MRGGTELGGRYRLEDRLGGGGMGAVWRGSDLRLKRSVAVKVLTPGLDPMTRPDARLWREGEAAARLQHPGITVVHDIGHHDGQPFVVMELLDGQDLKKVLDRSPGVLPIADTVSWVRQVADALAHAHERSIVHRDIKPANLMLLSGGRIKICDFGIARFAEATGDLTLEGGLVGTPAYMAPEQWEGKNVDARTDLYSLGCVMYALLAGHPPFLSGQPLNILKQQHLHDKPPRLGSCRPDVPTGLQELVAELLAKRPDDRPTSARAVSAKLDAWSSAVVAACPQPGQRVKTSTAPEVYLVDPDGGLNHLSDPTVYFNLWDTWDGIAVYDNLFTYCYSPDDYRMMSDAHLAKTSDSPRVYIWDATLQSGAAYRWITTPEIFDKYGFSWGKIRTQSSVSPINDDWPWDF